MDVLDFALPPVGAARHIMRHPKVAALARSQATSTLAASSSMDAGVLGGFLGMSDSSAPWGGMAMSILTTLLVLVSLVLVIVYGYRLSNALHKQATLGDPSLRKRAVDLAIAAPALMGVPFVNVGLGAALAATVTKLTEGQ